MQQLAVYLPWVVPVAILIAFGFAYWLARDVLRRETGTTPRPPRAPRPTCPSCP